MHICQVMGGDEEGGLETHFVDLCNGLKEAGDAVAAIAHERYRERMADGIDYLPLDLRRSRRNPLLRRRLRKLVESAAPDLVHAHAGKAAALLAAVRVSAPVVGTVHALKKNLSPYRRFAAVVGVSRGVLAGCDHPRKAIIHNGVHRNRATMTPAALRTRFGIQAHERVTLAVGRLVPVKGYDQLIAQWHDNLGHLLIVGEGPEHARLEALAVGKAVTLAGFQADVRTLMSAADLLVFASQREGFSYALAEALQARLPVVSTCVPGAEDVLPKSHLVPIDRLGTVIADCLADLHAARSRMAAAFDWAEQTLTVEHMVQATRQLYRDVLADTERPRC